MSEKVPPPVWGKYPLWMDSDNRRFLCSVSEAHDDGRVVCRTYYLTPQHYQLLWDGVSPLPASLDQVVENALDYSSQRSSKPMQVSKTKLQSSDVDGVGELHYYVAETTPVGTSKFLPASFVDGGLQVLVDLAGRVIEAERREFATSEEYDAFMDQRHPR